MSRRAIILAAAAVGVFFAVTLITLTHVITNGASGCTVAVPAPSLPASLRALGGFDQSYDAGNLQQLAQVGQNAAAVVSPNLDGATPLEPVRVIAASAGQPAAVVVPLAAPATTGSSTRLVGLISFYVGCSGRAYFGSVTQISAPGPAAPVSFPAVGQSAAALQLSTSTPQLVYTGSPFTPEWRNAQSGATIPAGE
ncbi:MAG TPA: hypothetical protein VG299_09045 [Candidatus Dormibacteraeota bacterium]|nr:hypothetical protein [Candidatus Dormibacteraeota bacterium]